MREADVLSRNVMTRRAPRSWARHRSVSTGDENDSDRDTRRSRRILWSAGVLGAALVVGPGLAPGPLLTLDLVVFDPIPFPDGFWGLGVEVPRAVPLWTALSGLGAVVGGPAATVALLLALLTVAFVGAARLVHRLPPAERVLAGALYALSPFLLTRVGVGHLGVVAAMAMLPWAAPTLMHPSRDPGRTLMWSAALGLAGLVGGVYAGVLIAVGWIADRRRSGLRVWAAYTIGQLPWLVPAVVSWWASAPDPAGAATFGTEVHGVLGPLELIAGQGFWRNSSQLGTGGAPAILVGATLLVLAVIGARAVPLGRRAAAVAVVGFVLPLASVVPGLKTLHAGVVETAFGAPLRESQRFLGLFLVWLAPAVALGVHRLVTAARGSPSALLARTAALSLAAFLALPGFWGAGGGLAPVTVPSSWDSVRDVVGSRPGTILALPWHRYFDVEFAQGRRVLNPFPAYLGGDVITSSDPELEPEVRERADPREAAVSPLVDAAAKGQPIGSRLAEFGVRWVILAKEADWRRWTALRSDPGLDSVLQSREIELYAVRDWKGPAVRESGATVEPDPIVAPLVRLPRGEAIWSHPWSRGWIRSGEEATRSPQGLMKVPGGGGPLWFWPALLVLAGYATTAAMVVGAALHNKRRDRPPTAR